MNTSPEVVELHVPRNHPCFADHFPDQAIVPGALLLQWVCQRLGSHLPGRRVGGVKSMKFLHPLRPGDECQLHFAPGASAALLKLQLRRREILVCHGVLELQAEDPSTP